MDATKVDMADAGGPVSRSTPTTGGGFTIPAGLGEELLRASREMSTLFGESVRTMLTGDAERARDRFTSSLTGESPVDAFELDGHGRPKVPEKFMGEWVVSSTITSAMDGESSELVIETESYQATYIYREAEDKLVLSAIDHKHDGRWKPSRKHRR